MSIATDHKNHESTFAHSTVALLSGLLFGLGLIISGMVNPGKVIGFLDLAGDWDPSLLFVMGGGVAVTTATFWLVLRRERPLFEKKFFLPTKADLDGRLLTGAALFGIGWGVGDLCPGPAITALATLDPSVVFFVGAMLLGMVLQNLVAE
ncbi:YeeE/YedE family protein [Gammaproteobacteria bacterium]|nr:YeeE/YedE family protein [Gammaproteobacteria bacterium]MDC1510970.1 YeeE/YedE family protein [Gammaproteobacteria bacterium]